MNAWLPNLLGYQLVWCGAVGGAAAGWWWLGPALLAGFAALQLPLGGRWRQDLRLMLGCGVLGVAVDSLWVALGWLQFASATPAIGLAPLWIVALWLAFGLTLNHSLAALKTRLLLAASLGLLGGPLAYHIAARVWHAAEIAPGAMPYIGLGIGWAVLTPALLYAASRPAAALAGWQPAR